VPNTKKPYEAALAQAKTPQECALDAAALITSFLPVVGGSISAILNAESNEKRWKRLEEFLLGVYDDLAKVKGKVKDADGSEEFEALLEETLRKVAGEPLSEKRELYRASSRRSLSRRPTPTNVGSSV
jgi:hypothetical protein